MKENVELAEKTGNVLTQIMNDEGNLVNIREFVDTAIPDEDVIHPVKNADGTAAPLPSGFNNT